MGRSAHCGRASIAYRFKKMYGVWLKSSLICCRFLLLFFQDRATRLNKSVFSLRTVLFSVTFRLSCTPFGYSSNVFKGTNHDQNRYHFR